MLNGRSSDERRCERQRRSLNRVNAQVPLEYPVTHFAEPADHHSARTGWGACTTAPS
ncbi:MAG: hypothetical protein M0C28_44260 [Candidatus Moduliflexus flocculans]|nr:hypothetical protein [Candidatus Moduliflexus flocculans]